ncbi:probable transmembrane ascorbate ferrireductase 3 [Chenopodium quinoa]|uniref:probable transmembrane ascorbate ferrireductase 3 n=1 Tax=Chenopodium quinoa TaxID=63459 RepID=UPI000B7712D8|nr:probable transmembrane ascorbate ferrireductase 3 [Chenopodium quinoa]
MDAIERDWYRRRASSITPVAHFFGILSIILLLVWLLHYRGGLSLDSDNPYRILNVHIFLMFFGFIFFAGQAMMVYKSINAEARMQKLTHMLMHVIAITLGIIGVYAAFKYHYKANVTNMYSLHSWIGLGTFIVYGIQWFFGFVTFWLPRPGATRARLAPWHVCFGRALLYFAICTAETGLMQLFTILKLANSNEGRLINFTGLAILIFGISVDLVIAISRYY